MHSPEKIHDHLILLGLEDVPAPNTIAKYLPTIRKDPTKKQMECWNPTIKMEVLYVFVILHHKTRKIVQFCVTKNPNTSWVKQQLRNATPYGHTPKYLIHDNDPVFKSKEIQDFLKSSGIQSKSTSYRSPWQNAYAERINGTLRRDVLDHLIPFNEKHLENRLAEYIYSYYNTNRPHQGIIGKTPFSSPIYLPSSVEKSKLKETPVLGGLYHTYKRVS